jgi:hypothetical protein
MMKNVAFGELPGDEFTLIVSVQPAGAPAAPSPVNVFVVAAGLSGLVNATQSVAPAELVNV